jgi:hypothetical protein
MNTNWEEEFDVPVGPANNIEPGGPDQGQPTHFYPRRNAFMFTITVPKEFATTTKELVWTLTTNGKTERAYASLNNDYLLDPQVISLEVGGDSGNQDTSLRSNKPPLLAVEGAKQRTVKVGEALTLIATASDPDNLPARRAARGARAAAPPSAPEGGAARGAAPAAGAAAPTGGRGLFIPPTSVVAPSSPAGLRFAWSVYRGKADAVAFSPEQLKTWQDTRPYANSPWSPGTEIPPPPPGGRWQVQATFREPGTYTLIGTASDSALFTHERVTVTVTR